MTTPAHQDIAAYLRPLPAGRTTPSAPTPGSVEGGETVVAARRVRGPFTTPLDAGRPRKAVTPDQGVARASAKVTALLVDEALLRVILEQIDPDLDAEDPPWWHTGGGSSERSKPMSRCRIQIYNPRGMSKMCLTILLNICRMCSTILPVLS